MNKGRKENEENEGRRFTGEDLGNALLSLCFLSLKMEEGGENRGN